jgi:phosphatidylglycerophosphatase A
MRNSRKIQDILITGVVSCAGLGFFPKGSGTVASFFALGFWGLLFVMGSPVWAIVALTLIFMVLGTLAIQAYERRTRTQDGSEIVIDEWVGMGISLWPAKMEPGYLIASFVLFRLFDIWKPPGVRYFDDNHMRGWGVMLDDVVAGLYALALIGVYRWQIGS